MHAQKSRAGEEHDGGNVQGIPELHAHGAVLVKRVWFSERVAGNRVFFGRIVNPSYGESGFRRSPYRTCLVLFVASQTSPLQAGEGGAREAGHLASFRPFFQGP